MSAEIKEENVKIDEETAAILAELEPADVNVGFLRAHNVFDPLTFKRQGAGLSMQSLVLNTSGIVRRLVSIDDNGNLREGEHLADDEVLLVGRKIPYYGVNDLGSACIITKFSGRSSVVYHNERSLSNIVKFYPDMKIIGVDTDIMDDYGEKAINVNAYDGRKNPDLQRRNYKTLEEFYNDGGDIFSLLGIRAPKYKVCQAGNLIKRYKPRAWIIQDLIPYAPSLCMIFAPPGTAKTYVVIDMGLTLASGKGDWFGLKAESCAVLYMCGEGEDSILLRIMAWLQEYDMVDKATQIPFYIVTNPVKLNEAPDMEEFQRTLELYFRQYKPKVVVVDTMNLFMSGDENDTKDSTSLVTALKDFTMRNQCVLILVHHSGVGNKERGRGSSVFPGAMDSILQIEDRGNGVKALIQTKNRSKKIHSRILLTLEERHIAEVIDPDTQEEAIDCVLKLYEKGKKIDSEKSTEEFSQPEQFIIETCFEKWKKGEDWLKISHKELVSYCDESEIYGHYKTSAAGLMNANQPGKPLYNIVTNNVLTPDYSQKEKSYILSDERVIDAVRTLISEECITDIEESRGW